MLRDTHLVQRMCGPRPDAHKEGVKIHHVFGGHALGLTENAWKVIDPICTLDYMGAAEYEAWGGTSPVLGGFHNLALLAQQGRLRSFAFNLGPHERELNWSRGYPRKGQKLPPARTVTLFGICAEEILVAVQERVRAMAMRENAFYVKRGTKLVDSLDPLEAQRDPVLGWFELDNTFLFFSDQKMWEGFCGLFEVEKCEVPARPVSIDYSIMGKGELVKVAVKLGMYPNQTQAKKVSKPDLVKALNDSQTAGP